MKTCPRRISFLIAKKSYEQKHVGLFARLLQSIPLQRCFSGDVKLFDPHRLEHSNCSLSSESGLKIVRANVAALWLSGTPVAISVVIKLNSPMSWRGAIWSCWMSEIRDFRVMSSMISPTTPHSLWRNHWLNPSWKSSNLTHSSSKLLLIWINTSCTAPYSNTFLAESVLESFLREDLMTEQRCCR